MFIYAQIKANKVEGISYLSGEVAEDDLINVSSSGKLPNIGWDYDSETGVFTEPVPPEPIGPTPSIEEQILYENKYQTMILEMGGM